MLLAKRSESQEQLVAAFYPSSLACAALKAFMFRLLRVRTTRQRKINVFRTNLCKKRAKVLKRVILFAWRQVVDVARRGLCLQRWKDQRSKLTTFDAWFNGFRTSAVLIPTVARKTNQRVLRRAFSALLDVVQRRKATDEVEERHALYVTLFQSIRVFRAWKHLTRASLDRTQSCLTAIRERTLQKMFDAWAAVAKEQQTQHALIVQSIRHTAARLSTASSFAVWCNLLQYRSQLGVYRRKKRAFAVLYRRIHSQCDQRKLQAMVAVVAASPHGLMRGRLLLAWKRWNLRTARKKYFRRAAQTLRKRQAELVEFRVLCSWRSLLRYRRSLYRKQLNVIAQCGNRVLHRHFAVWKAAATHRRVLVPQLREKWLNLFSDPPLRNSTLHDRSGRIRPELSGEKTLLHPAVESAGGGVTEKTSRLRQSLSNFEFQLLYWDDDDHSDSRQDGESEHLGEGVENARTYCVLLRRYVSRWRARSTRRWSLQSRLYEVQLLASKYRARRSFSVALGLFSSSVLKSRNECQKFLRENTTPDVGSLQAPFDPTDAALVSR